MAGVEEYEGGGMNEELNLDEDEDKYDGLMYGEDGDDREGDDRDSEGEDAFVFCFDGMMFTLKKRRR